MPCDADPCRNGATCLNTGQSFTCVCRDGFEGQHCQLEQQHHHHHRQHPQKTAVVPSSSSSILAHDQASSSSCLWSGRLYPEDSSWDDGCNKCQCRAGRAVCSRVWCGPVNCLDDPERHCPGSAEMCLPIQSGCLRPPCQAWGQCRPLKPGRLLPVPAATAACWPNLTGQRLAPTCARLTLVMDRFRAAPGLSVQTLCGHLRKLAASQSHLWDNNNGLVPSAPGQPQLVILCDLKDHLEDVIQVTVVS